MLGGALGQFALGQFKPPDDSVNASATLGALTSSITGQAIVSASIGTTLGSLTSLITGKAIVSASVGTTLGDLSSSITGFITTGINASITQTLAPLTSYISVTLPPPYGYFQLGEAPSAIKIFARTKIFGKSEVRAFSKTLAHSQANLTGESITDFISRVRITTKTELRTEIASIAVVGYASVVDHGWEKRDRTIRRNNSLLLMS